MKRNRKTRLLSLLLALAICIELLPAVGLAAPPPEGEAPFPPRLAIPANG